MQTQHVYKWNSPGTAISYHLSCSPPTTRTPSNCLKANTPMLTEFSRRILFNEADSPVPTRPDLEAPIVVPVSSPNAGISRPLFKFIIRPRLPSPLPLWAAARAGHSNIYLHTSPLPGESPCFATKNSLFSPSSASLRSTPSLGSFGSSRLMPMSPPD